MKLEMRRKLAKLPYEEKIRMAGELVKFAREFKKCPIESGDHFYRCAKCGQLVDKRESREVTFHETDHKSNPPIA